MPWFSVLFQTGRPASLPSLERKMGSGRRGALTYFPAGGERLPADLVPSPRLLKKAPGQPLPSRKGHLPPGSVSPSSGSKGHPTAAPSSTPLSRTSCLPGTEVRQPQRSRGKEDVGVIISRLTGTWRRLVTRSESCCSAEAEGGLEPGPGLGPTPSIEEAAGYRGPNAR